MNQQFVAWGCTVAAATSGAFAQAYLSWEAVPHVYTQSPEVFRELFGGAHCRTVRAAMFGDSQEVCPDGFGTVYFTRFAYELAVKYGNTPETPITSGWAGFDAHWMLRMAYKDPGVSESRFPGNALPPLVSPCKTSAANGSNVNGNQLYGSMFFLQHDAIGVDPVTQIPTAMDYFHPGSQVYIDVFGGTNASSGELRCRVTPSDAPACNFHLATSQIFDTSMGLETPGPAETRVQRLGPLDFAGKAYMQVEVSGTDPTKFTDLLAARFVNLGDPRGFAVTTFSQGGYRATSLQLFHAQCGSFLSAVGMDVAIITLGANDGGNEVPEGEFRDSVQSLMGFIRASTRSDLPVILMVETRRLVDPGVSIEPFEHYAGVAYAIAQADARVCVVNSRRLCEEAGYNAENFATYVADVVHHTPAGAILKANLEVGALYDAFGGRCAADLDDGTGVGQGDCGVDVSDLIYFLGQFELGGEAANLDDGTGAGTPDDGVDINDLLFFLGRFEVGC